MHPIARYRLARGWTQTDLAQKLGVHLNSVQAWEKGARPRPKLLSRLAQDLEVDSLQLLDEIEGWRQKKVSAT